MTVKVSDGDGAVGVKVALPDTGPGTLGGAAAAAGAVLRGAGVKLVEDFPEFGAAVGNDTTSCLISCNGKISKDRQSIRRWHMHTSSKWAVTVPAHRAQFLFSGRWRQTECSFSGRGLRFFLFQPVGLIKEPPSDTRF